MPRRSSPQDPVVPQDLGYSRALLQHQRARMERLERELEAARARLLELQSSVLELEALRRSRRDHRRDPPSADPAPGPQELGRLRALNRKLQVDIDLALKELDLLESRASRASRREEQRPQDPPGPEEGPEEPEGDPWTCHICTLHNHPALFRCEACDMPRS